MMKKYFLFLIVICICAPTLHAQNGGFRAMNEQQKKEHLADVAKEVVAFIAPAYLEGDVDIAVSNSVDVFTGPDNRNPHIKKYYGSKYYTVTLSLKNTSYESKVQLLEDSGEPIAVLFSHHMGRNFFFDTFKELKEKGVGKDQRITKLE